MAESEVKSSLASTLSQLSLDRKLYVLSLLAHNLTVSGRGVYSQRSNEDETTDKLYTLNEVQHRLSSQLMHLASKDGDGQPDAEFIDSLYDFAKRNGCERELTSALKYTLSATNE
jgi:hypothetical protein